MKPATPVRRMVAHAADAALELTVVGGFGSPGIRTRRLLHGWDPLPPFTGRTVVITGATSGLGLAAATQMRRLGADLVLVGRDPARTAETAERIDADSHSAPGSAVGLVADLTSLEAARRVARDLLATVTRLDALVHNAGALSAAFQRTPEGFEATYAAQVLSPHVLTTELLPLLAGTPDSRVITVSSGGMYTQQLVAARMQMDDPDGYDGVRAYALAKRAQVAMTSQWARRFGHVAQFHSMHPGWADTPGVRDSLPTFQRITRPILRTPAEGADTMIWLAGVHPIPGPNGSFWLDRRPRRTIYLPGTSSAPDEPARLWDIVCEQSGSCPSIPDR